MVKRKIVVCSESLRLSKAPTTQNEKYSIDGETVIGLLKNNIEVLRTDLVEIEATGFGDKDEFRREVPYFVLSKFTEYRHRSNEVELFIVALRDTDTNDNKKIASIRRKLVDKIKKLITAQEFNRVHIMFAVQAIEAWILADEQKLNEYLKVTNKAKHINEPEKVDNPKQVIQNFFQQWEQRGRKYTSQELLNLFPQLRVSELLRCKHFKEFYARVQKIVEASA